MNGFFTQRYNPILLSVAFCIFLSTLRLLILQNITFVFLVWNLVLALIPYILSKWVVEKNSLRPQNLLAVAVCIGFLPNAPYLLTDLFHLRYQPTAFIWFDTLLIASYAFTGLGLFILTLKNLSSNFSERLSPRLLIFLRVILVFMCGFGIYLGRYMRFNSWDVVTNPLYLLSEIADRFMDPMSHPLTWGVTLAYGAFLMVADYTTSGWFPAQHFSCTHCHQ